jgi:hypothetical protein
MKLLSKTRTGPRVTKKYDEAKTPWQRLDAAGTLSEADSMRLTEQYQSLNPAKQRRDVEALEMGLRRFTISDPDPISVESLQLRPHPTTETSPDASRDASGACRAPKGGDVIG